MRTYLSIISILFLLFSTVHAATLTIPVSGTAGAAGNPAWYCTSPEILAWHFESLTDVTVGTPAGCNSNASVVTTNTGGQLLSSGPSPTDGTYSWARLDVNQNITIPTSVNKSVGTIVFDFQPISSMTAWRPLMRFYVDAGNEIEVRFDSTSTLEFYYKGNTTFLGITSSTLTADVWQTITIKWSVAGVGGKYLYIKVGAANAVEGTTAITEIIGTPSVLEVGKGINENYANSFAIDNLHLYNNWQ